MLLAVPNVSEGRDARRIDAIWRPRSRPAPRSSTATPTPTTTAPSSPSPAEPARSRRRWSPAREHAIEPIDMRAHDGAHPASARSTSARWSGSTTDDRDAARRGGPRGRAADRAGSAFPVFLYGELAPHREPSRARLTSATAAWPSSRARMEAGELPPDFGPAEPHPTRRRHAGHRPPAARRLQRRARQRRTSPRRGRSPPRCARPVAACRACGRSASTSATVAPRSRPTSTTRRRALATVAERVRELAGPHGARPVGAEIVGLVPERALDGWPDALPITGFDPAKHVIERRVRV